jgi:hypothetical protein
MSDRFLGKHAPPVTPEIELATKEQLRQLAQCVAELRLRLDALVLMLEAHQPIDEVELELTIERLRSLQQLAEQAQELDMGY